MLYSTRIFCCWESCGGERNDEEVLHSAGCCLGLSALCWTFLTMPWKSVPWLLGRTREPCAHTQSMAAPSQAALWLMEMIGYETKLLSVSTVSESGESQSAPLVTTSQAASSDRGWQLGCPWFLLLPAAVSGQRWTHLSTFWNPIFTGIAGSFAHCRQGYSKFLYLFVLQVLKKHNLIHVSFTVYRATALPKVDSSGGVIAVGEANEQMWFRQVILFLICW